MHRWLAGGVCESCRGIGGQWGVPAVSRVAQLPHAKEAAVMQGVRRMLQAWQSSDQVLQPCIHMVLKQAFRVTPVGPRTDMVGGQSISNQVNLNPKAGGGTAWL